MSLILKNRNLLPSLATDFFETGNLFPRFFDFNGDEFDFEKNLIVPDANILETAKEFKIELAVPGLEKKDFRIETKDGMLTIRCEKEKEKKEEGKNYRRREFSYNLFSRSFMLPENLEADKIEARYENGILVLTLPKKDVTLSKPKKEIKVF